VRKKLRLDVSELAVAWFRTADAGDWPRGSVRAEAPCTCVQSCACPTAIHGRADIAATVHSQRELLDDVVRSERGVDRGGPHPSVLPRNAGDEP